MRTLGHASLVIGGLGFVGMGTGVGLVLGGITEACCIAGFTLSIPGAVYLASAATAAVAMLLFVLIRNYEWGGGKLAKYSAFNAGVIAASLGAYAITQYCLSLGMIEQALVAGGMSALGAAICLGAWYRPTSSTYSSLATENQKSIIGYLMARVGVCAVGVGVITTMAVAASSALPLLLEAGITAEMMIAAQWLTVAAIVMPANICMDSIMSALQGAKVPGFRIEDYRKVGAIFV